MPARSLRSLRSRIVPPALTACVLSLALGFASAARAHTDEYLDTLPSPHGGLVRMAGPLHLELVVVAKAVEVYVTDHAGAPRPTEDGKARVRIGSEGAVTELRPAGANRFAATLAEPPPLDAEFTLFVKLSDEDAQSARFSPRPKDAPTTVPSAPQPHSAPEEKAHAHHAH